MWLSLLVTLVATAEVRGTPEPCGCNSDPLGDVARVATLAKGGLWLDAGSLSYNPDELSPLRRQLVGVVGQRPGIEPQSALGQRGDPRHVAERVRVTPARLRGPAHLGGRDEGDQQRKPHRVESLE